MVDHKHRTKPDVVDETICATGGDTALDFDDLVRQAVKLSSACEAPDERCVQLIDRLKDSDEIRRLAKATEGEDSFSPRQLGPYELLEVLGGGGMGQVFRARHTRLGKVQAVKILHAHRLSDVEAKARFHQEMRAIGQLQHPNVVSAHHADEVDGVPYLVMDYVEGQSLSETVSRNRHHDRQISIAAACELVRQAAGGIQYAHEQGVIHRDIKPGNIMLDRSGHVRVLDLGLARLTGQDDETAPELTTDEQVLGTPDYMAPEQLRSSRNVDQRTDIYALGATLYYLLTGEVTFPSEPLDSLMNKAMRVLNDPAPDVRKLRPDVPRKLADVVAACLEKDPEKRPQSAGELVDLLAPWSSTESLAELWLESEPVCDDSVGAGVRPKFAATPQTATAHVGNSSRRRLLIALGVLVPLLIAAGILLRLKLPGGGELVVECDDPNAQITIAAVQGKQTETLKLSTQRDGSLKLSEGTWEIQIKGLAADEYELSSNRIVISAGGTEKLRVTRKPPPAASQRSVAAVSKPKPKLPSESNSKSKVERKGNATPVESVSALTEAESKWQLGPGFPSVHGLLSQPAELPGIGEWNIRNRLLPGGVMGLGTTYARHLDTVDPSGQFFIWSDETTTYVSEVETGHVIRILPYLKDVRGIYHIAVTRGAERVAMLTHDLHVLVWDERNRVVQDWKLDDDLAGRAHSFGETPSLRWLPEGRQLVVWTGRIAKILADDGRVVESLDFPEKGGPCHFINTQYVITDALAINPANGDVAFGCFDSRIRIWKQSTGEWAEFGPIPNEADSGAQLLSVAWAPDGSRLAAGFHSRSRYGVQTWNASGTPERSYTVKAPWGLCWSPSGRFLVTGGGELLSVDGATETIRKLPPLHDSPTTNRLSWRAYWLSSNRIDFVSTSTSGRRGRGQVRSFTPTGRQLPSASQRTPLAVADSAWISEDESILVNAPVGYSDEARDFVIRYQAYDAGGTIGNRFDLRSGNHGSVAKIAPRGGRTWVLKGSEILIHDGEGNQTGSVRYEGGEQPFASWRNGWDTTGSRFALWVQRDDHPCVDVIASDGTRQHRLELNPKANAPYHGFAWSPSGTLLALVSRKEDGTCLVTIWRVDESTKPIVEFSNAGTVGQDVLSWSPDSNWLANFSGNIAGIRPGSLRLCHLPSLHVFEANELYFYDEVPFWWDETHVQTSNRLIVVSTESPNGVARIKELPFGTDHPRFSVGGMVPDESVDLRWSANEFDPGPALDIWTPEKRVATIPLIGRQFNPQAAPSSRPTPDGLCLLSSRHCPPFIVVVDLNERALRFVAMAYDDGAAITLGPAGRIIDGPDDVDSYLMYIIGYPGGAEVALTRREFHARIGLDEAQRAVNWILDIGGAIRLVDTEQWLTRRDVPVSDPLPDPNLVVGVDLSSCVFDEQESLPSVAALSSLVELRLSDSAITKTHLVSRCMKLTKLDLSNTPIDSVFGLTKMSDLRELDLSGTKVRSSIGPTLAGLTKLEAVDLANTEVDEFLLSDLSRLAKLRRLDLTGLKVPSSAIKALQAAMPGCEIKTASVEE